MKVTPEEKEFQLEYYGQFIAFSLQLYRTAGSTALAVVTTTADDTAYRQLTVQAVTYACAVYRLDLRHILWVERIVGPAPASDSYTLVEFDRNVSLVAGKTQVCLDNPVRTPLPADELKMILSKLGRGEGHSA